jgi:hypothetical protein
MMKSLELRFILLATIFSLVAMNSNAQEKKPEIPVPVQNLMKFIGKWQADATLTMEGKTYKVNYWVNCTKTADGYGLMADEGFTHPELGTLSGANLVGYDPFDSKIKWFSVDNMGTAHEHVGSWETPDHLYIENNGMHDGKKYIEKIHFIFKGKNEMDFKLISTLDGIETEKAEGIFRKK